jgi:hypothetical protein
MPLRVINTNQNLIGLVNRTAISIHHPASRARIWLTAFILHERARLIVNDSYPATGHAAPRHLAA